MSGCSGRQGGRAFGILRANLVAAVAALPVCRLEEHPVVDIESHILMQVSFCPAVRGKTSETHAW